MYRCVATSVEGFVQQLAVGYVAHGHWFYVHGEIPAVKDAAAVDQKLIERYGVDTSRAERCRRRAAGFASVQYIRYEREFVLVATHGQHRYFDDESGAIRDCRRVPIKFHGYSIAHRGGHASVRIEQDEFRRLKAYFTDIAVHRRASALEAELATIPFARFAPVRQQIISLWRTVNRLRKERGFELLPFDSLSLKRRIVSPFEPQEGREAASVALHPES